MSSNHEPTALVRPASRGSKDVYHSDENCPRLRNSYRPATDDELGDLRECAHCDGSTKQPETQNSAPLQALKEAAQ